MGLVVPLDAVFGFFSARAAGHGNRYQPKSSGERITLQLPEGVDWEIHRIATSDRYTVSLKEIENEWSMADLERANQVLNAIEISEAKATKLAEQKAKSKR